MSKEADKNLSNKCDFTWYVNQYSAKNLISASDAQYLIDQFPADSVSDFTGQKIISLLAILFVLFGVSFITLVLVS